MIRGVSYLVDNNQLKVARAFGDSIVEVNHQIKRVFHTYPNATVVFQIIFKESPEELFQGVLKELVREQISLGKIRDETLESIHPSRTPDEKPKFIHGETLFIENGIMKNFISFGLGISEISKTIRDFINENPSYIIVSNIIYGEGDPSFQTDIVEELQKKELKNGIIQKEDLIGDKKSFF